MKKKPPWLYLPKGNRVNKNDRKKPKQKAGNNF